MSQHLNYQAFNRGFNAFMNNVWVSPFEKDSPSYKEWERGRNAAYFMWLERTKKRESYRRT